MDINPGIAKPIDTDNVIPETLTNTTVEQYRLEDYQQETDDLTYRPKIDLTEEQKQELIMYMEANLDMIDKERRDDCSETRWRELDNQFWGNVREDSETMFKTHVHLTYDRCTKIENRLHQAFFESDPVFSVTTRPGYSGNMGEDDATLQEQYLDYIVDTDMHLKEQFSKIFHEATLKDGGIAKIVYEKDYEYVRKVESYKGDENGLFQFLINYKDAKTKYPGYVRKLENGEDIKIVAYKPECTYEGPRLYFTPFEDFFISLRTQGMLGLRFSRFFAERQRYSWHELLDEVEENRFDKDAVEDLMYNFSDEGATLNPSYMDEEYQVFECNLFYDIKGQNKPKRIVVWYERERRIILSAIHYPYDHGRPYYIPFFTTNKKSGWHQPGAGIILKPQNVVANASTNLMLDKAFYQLQPIMRVSPNTGAASRIMMRKWRIGDPLVAGQGEVEMMNFNVGGFSELLNIITYNDRLADSSIGVNSANLSGRADPVDPDAPAKKTTALINETNINIKAYILSLLPSFQELGHQLLQLMAQYKDTDRFKLRHSSVTGQEAKTTISAEQMRFRTNLTPNAYMFEPDKVNEKRLNLSLLQALTGNPVLATFLQRDPKAAWELGRMTVKSWSQAHANKINQIWPDEQQVNKQMVDVQKQAIMEMMQEQQGQVRPPMPGQQPPAQPQGGMQ